MNKRGTKPKADVHGAARAREARKLGDGATAGAYAYVDAARGLAQDGEDKWSTTWRPDDVPRRGNGA